MQVTVTIAAEDQKFIDGTVAGNWRIEALAADAVAFEYEGVDPTTTFDMPEGNTYTLRSWRLSVNHAPLGPVASMDFTVGSDLEVISVASGITAKSSPNGVAAR